MAIPVSTVPPINDLVRRRAQLLSRQTQVEAMASLGDMASLFEGTGLEGQVLVIAKQQVLQYLANAIAGIEAQLVEAGVLLDG